jgi:hypothetical protein
VVDDIHVADVDAREFRRAAGLVSFDDFRLGSKGLAFLGDQDDVVVEGFPEEVRVGSQFG